MLVNDRFTNKTISLPALLHGTLYMFTGKLFVKKLNFVKKMLEPSSVQE